MYTFERHYWLPVYLALIVLTLSLAKLGTVCPGEAALEAQLSAQHIGKFDIHLVIAHCAPRSVVEHLYAPLICIPSTHACKTYLHILGRQLWEVEEKQGEEDG